MALISKLSLNELIDLNNKLTGQLAGCTALEDAAQVYMSILHEAFSESIILARLFASVPFEELPEPNKEFVRNLAQSQASANLSEHVLPGDSKGKRNGRTETTWLLHIAQYGDLIACALWK